MARMRSAYWPGSSRSAGKLKRPSLSLTTVVVMVEPSFLALTSTPSIAPSSAEVTMPINAAPFCEKQIEGRARKTADKIQLRMRCSLVFHQSGRRDALFLHHEDEGLHRHAIAWISRDDVNIVRRFVVRVAGIERHRLAALELNDELAFEDVQEHMRIVAVRRVWGGPGEKGGPG